jgi:hypothetical protein
MTRAVIVLSIAALPLSACAATAESRVRASLIDAGLSQRMAGCMAGRMVDRLSMTQLRSLSRLAGIRERDIAEMNVDEFLRRSRALVDPEIYAVLASAGLRCALRA